MKKIFDEFTNKYQIQKTLRFELKPVGETKEWLKKNRVFKKDEIINKSYQYAKFYFDDLHREFIKSALKNVDILSSLNNFYKIWKDENKKLKKDRDFKSLRGSQKKIREIIKKQFVDEDIKWEGENEKRNKIKFILSKDILSVLKNRFPKEKNEEFLSKGYPGLVVEDENGNKKYIFDAFDGFSTYLTNFQESRNNFYDSNGIQSAVATRVVGNFAIFLLNKENFENNYKNVSKKVGLEKNKEIFEIEFYQRCFLQEGVDAYNELLGRINKQIKEFRDKEQSKAKEEKEKFNKSRYPLFKKLDKQILGEVEKEKQLIEKDADVFSTLRDFIKINEEKLGKAKDLMKEMFSGNFSENYDNIYINNRAINTISRRWFKDYEIFEDEIYKNSANKKFASLAEIRNVLEKMDGEIFKDNYYKNNEKRGMIEKDEQDKFEQFLKIWEFEFNNLYEDAKRTDGSEFHGYKTCLNNAKKVSKFERKKDEIEKIKCYADTSLNIYQMMKYLSLSAKKQDDIPDNFSTDFYAKYDEFYQDFPFIKYYNALRNFITKNLFSENKIKLNFENGQLLSGFDKNKESEKFGVILKKEEKTFLAVLNKNHNKIFDEKKTPEMFNFIGDEYKKMEYKLFPDAKRMIPHIAFAESNKQKFGWTKEIQKIKDEFANFQKIKKDDSDLWKQEFDRVKLNKLIDFYQKCLEGGGYKSTFDFNWKKPAEYKNIGQFNEEIDKQGYLIKFIPVNKKLIDEKVAKGELYLFEIRNKDQNLKDGKKKTGSKNTHTLYFENLFSEKNLANPVFKLSGGAEIFYRPKTDKEKLGKRKDNNGKEVVRNKRYAKDNILFHFPIVINMLAKSGIKNKQFNEELNKKIVKNKKGINIIGIDRGEKHLAYYSIINQRGEILDQGSLNKLKVGNKEVNFKTLLVEREKQRLIDRQSWNPVTRIKDLKKGYLSGLIRKICDLAVEHNAIIVLEDLNIRFKQVRGGIERSVYQQMEKALIDKLNYLIFKNRDDDEIGGSLNGYQLSAPFESFEKMGKQSGIIFYVQAEYTSITDPLTGFRKNVYISNSASQEKIKKMINNFDAIVWDNEEKSYRFDYDVINFSNGKNVKSRKWKVYSMVARIAREKDKNGYWQYNPVDLNRKFKDLFELWQFDTHGDILKQIKEKTKNNKLGGSREFDKKQRDFYHSFIYLFNLILQLRNSFSEKFVLDEKNKIKFVGEEIDFIASPVKPFFSTKAINKKGEILAESNLIDFENKIISKEKKRILEEFNGDANGAYNIARKGILLLDKIEKGDDLYIKNQEWDDFGLE